MSPMRKKNRIAYIFALNISALPFFHDSIFYLRNPGDVIDSVNEWAGTKFHHHPIDWFTTFFNFELTNAKWGIELNANVSCGRPYILIFCGQDFYCGVKMWNKIILRFSTFLGLLEELGGASTAYWPNYPVYLPSDILGFEGLVQTSGTFSSSW